MGDHLPPSSSSALSLPPSSDLLLLDFVPSDIDPATVRPLDHRDLATTINEILLRSADILNTFCAKFEQRMLTLESRLDSFERLLLLMERKLESIPLMSDERTPKIEEKEEQMREEAREREGAKEEEEKKKEEDEAEEKEREKRMAEEEGMVRAREHPSTAKYFRMLRMGVPEPAVKQKMRSEGMDSTVLDDPEKLLPRINKRANPTATESPSSSSAEGDDDLSADE